jgi:hypothetical protein
VLTADTTVTGSLLPDPNREPSAYKAAALPIAPRRPSLKLACARRELNPQHPGSRPGLSSSWSTSTPSCLPWIRTTITGTRLRRPACWTKRHRVRDALPTLPRTPPGNRTPLCGLRVRSITTMLAAQGLRESRWDRTSDLPGFDRTLCRTELETRGRDAGTRTPSAASQGRSANPYATSRWRRPESNRLDGACRARPVPYLSSPRKRGARYRVIPGGSCPIFRRA